MSDNHTTAELRRLRQVNRRIAELQDEQRELIASLGLDDADEAIIIGSLELANEIQVFIDQVRGEPTLKQKRRGIILSRKLERAVIRLEKLPDTDARTAAVAATAEAGDRLLARIYNA
jgi:hypothetical protein